MILTIDIGSSSLKAACISPDGELLDYQRIPYKDRFSSRRSEEWVSAFSKAIGPFKKSNITAVSLCSNGPTLVPMDKSNTVLDPVLFWQDNPPTTQYKSYYIPELIQYRLKRPRDWEKTACFLSPAEYLGWLLTGNKTAVSPNPEFRDRLWSAQELNDQQIGSVLFPEITDFRGPIGITASKVCTVWDLPAGLPVFCVGSDFLAALLGSGTLSEGMICDRAGSSEGINYCSERDVRSKTLRTLPHIADGYYNIAYIMGSTGALFEHYKELLGFGSESYDRIMSLVLSESVNLTSEIFIPSGNDGVFTGLNDTTSNLTKLSAVILSLACLFRLGIEELEKAGLPVNSLMVSGGQGRNTKWNQIKADISGKVLHKPKITDCELTGCAVLALAYQQGTGSLETVSKELVRLEETFEPISSAKKTYDAYYKKFLASI